MSRNPIMILAFLMLPLGAAADPLRPCPAPVIQMVCDGNVPALRVMRDSDDLDLTLVATQPGGPLGDRLIRMAPGQGEAIVPMSRVGSITLAMAGMGADPAQCCFTTLTVPQSDLECVPTSVAEPVEDIGPTPDTGADAGTNPADFAVSVDLPSDCPLGAIGGAVGGTAGNKCGGVLTLTQPLGDVSAGHLPLVLYADQGEVTLTGPLPCYDLGGATRFCQAPAAVMSAGLALPITLHMAVGYQPRQVTVCAEFTPPEGSALVRLVQSALSSLGFDAGPPDGQAGPKTQAAVAAFSQAQGITASDPLDPALLAVLGLGAFGDVVPGNNRSCASTTLVPAPTPDCDPHTTRFSQGACRCRFDGMQRNASGLACSCKAGSEFVAGAGCVQIKAPTPTPAPRVIPFPIPIPGLGGLTGGPVNAHPTPAATCDPSSTVKRGDTCACRYKDMTHVSPSRCVCSSGLSLIAGRGCS